VCVAIIAVILAITSKKKMWKLQRSNTSRTHETKQDMKYFVASVSVLVGIKIEAE
jgi:hypothetical protein